jgi:hypothetical protein
MAVSGISKISEFPSIGSLTELQNSHPFSLRPVGSQYLYVGGLMTTIERYDKQRTGTPPEVDLKRASSYLIQHIEDKYPHKLEDEDSTTEYWYGLKKRSDGFLEVELLTLGEKEDFTYDSSQDILDIEETLKNHAKDSIPIHKIYDEDLDLDKGYYFLKDITLDLTITDTFTYSVFPGEIEDQEYDSGYLLDSIDKHQEENENLHTISNILLEGENCFKFSIVDGFLTMQFEEETLL